MTAPGGLAARERREAYASGVLAASSALMRDLEVLGVLGDAEVLGHSDDGGELVCSSCQMRRFGYDSLATRFEFAVGVARQGAL